MQSSRSKIFKILLIIAGALAIVQFFIYPFYVLNGEAVKEMNDVLKDSGIDLSFPSLYSCFTLIVFVIRAAIIAGKEADISLTAEDVFLLISMFLILVTGITTLIFGIVGRKKGFIAGIISGGIMLAANIFLLVEFFGDMGGLGINPSDAAEEGVFVNRVYFLILLVPILAIIASIIGLVMESKAASAYSSSPVGSDFPDEAFRDEPGRYSPGNTYDPSNYSGGGQLIGIKGQYAGASFPLAPGAPILIGRDGNRCQLVVASEKVSRTHCYVKYDPQRGGYEVTDVSSVGVFNATRQPIPPRQPVLLTPGDEIHLGYSHNVFRLG